MNEYLRHQSLWNAIWLKNHGINLYDSTDLENSDKFRIEGNLKFGEDKHFAAIAQYNKALICGRNDKVRSSLCYANRSAVYLELGYFKHCLHNIELAEENYPREKIQKLHERREKCLEMMENSADKATDAFMHTFKLSYEPNSKLPFFIDSLELREDSKFRKHLVSTRDLKAGDVIAVIDPWRDSINSLVENYVQGCYTCHDTNNGDLISGECKAFFCSEACKSNHEHQNSNHEEFNELENVFPSTIRMSSDVKFLLHMLDVFGSVDEMKKFVDGHRDKQYTVFDFDWSNPKHPMYYKNMLLTIFNTEKPKNDGETLRLFQDLCSSFLKSDSKLYRILYGNKKNEKFLDEILHVIFNRTKIAMSAWGDTRWNVAYFSHPSINLLIPSCCEGNVFVHTNRKDLILTAFEPISAGSPVMVTMFDNDGRSCCYKCSSSQEALYSCNKDLSSMENKIAVGRSQTNSMDFLMLNGPKKLTNWLQYLKVCFELINENFDNKYDNDPNMKLEIKANLLLEIKTILLLIGNPFPPSNPCYYPSMDELCNPTARKTVQKSLEIEFETEVVGNS